MLFTRSFQCHSTEPLFTWRVVSEHALGPHTRRRHFASDGEVVGADIRVIPVSVAFIMLKCLTVKHQGHGPVCFVPSVTLPTVSLYSFYAGYSLFGLMNGKNALEKKNLHARYHLELPSSPCSRTEEIFFSTFWLSHNQSSVKETVQCQSVSIDSVS